MEVMAEEAAFVIAVKAEVLQLMPVSPETLEEKWVNRYELADPDVCLEIQSAIMNRNCNNVRDIPTIRAIMDNHSGSTPLPSQAVIEMSRLEQETFSLKMKQLEYDVQACRVARAKRQTWESQVHHAKLQYRVQAYQDSVKAAKHFMNEASSIITYQKSDDLVRAIQTFMSEKNQRLKLDESTNVTWHVLAYKKRFHVQTSTQRNVPLDLPSMAPKLAQAVFKKLPCCLGLPGLPELVGPQHAEAGYPECPSFCCGLCARLERSQCRNDAEPRVHLQAQ